MDKLILTHQEFVYIAALLGTNELFGIENPFRRMTPDETIAILSTVQQSLDEQGIVTVGFVGECHVNDFATQLVGICAYCDSCLLVNASSCEQTIVYRRGQDMVMVRFIGGRLSVKLCENNEVYSALEETLSGIAICDKTASCRIDQESFLMVQRQIAFGENDAASRKLKESGWSQQVIDAFLSFSEKKEMPMVLSVINFKTNSVNAYLLLPAVLCGLMMHIQPRNAECPMWEISMYTRTAYEEMLARLLKDME